MQEEFILDALNELIETCQDSEQDFLLCAQRIGADKRYRIVMQTSLLPAPVQATLMRHFHAWQHVHHQMQSMHGLLKASM